MRESTGVTFFGGGMSTFLAGGGDENPDISFVKMYDK